MIILRMARAVLLGVSHPAMKLKLCTGKDCNDDNTLVINSTSGFFVKKGVSVFSYIAE